MTSQKKIKVYTGLITLTKAVPLIVFRVVGIFYIPMWPRNEVQFVLKLFRAYSGYIRHETFSFMMSLPAMSLGLRFCVSRKGGTGGGRWVHPKGANSMAASGLVFRSNLVGTGRPFLSLLAPFL